MEPYAHRDMAGLEDGSDLYGKWLAAVLALVHADAGALALHLAILLDATTVRANRTTRPDTGFRESIGGYAVMEVRGRKDGIAHTVILLLSGYFHDTIRNFSI